MKAGDLIAAKYRLESVLGKGAMGEVWAAIDEGTGGAVAVKLMHSSAPELRARMLREARAGCSIKHRNVVEVLSVGETEHGDPFLVMEQLSGETLAERLRRVGRLPPARAAEIAGAIAGALRVAHAKGIVHRDLKPANVFLHREAQGEIVKVLDFGVSKHLQEATGTMTGGLVGSPAYMSPEQARAERTIDARADLWSLGVVLFEMLAGRRPFPSTSPYVVITEVLTGPVPSIAEVVPEVSPALARVVDRCLTRDVGARVGSAEELIRLLGPLAEPTRRALSPAISGITGGHQAVPRAAPQRALPPAPPVATDEDLTAKREVPAPPRAPAPPRYAGQGPALGPLPMIELTTPSMEDAPTLPRTGAVDSITAPFKASGSQITHRILEIEAAAGTTAPLVRSPPAPGSARRSPQPVTVLLVGVGALSLLVVVGVTLWRAASPAAESAASTPAATEPAEATDATSRAARQVVPRPPPPGAPSAPPGPSPAPDATAEPGTAPRLGKDEALIVVDAPEATQVSLDGKPSSVVPVAPLIVPAGAHRIFFKHPTLGERVVLVQVQAGEISLAAAEFGSDGGTRPPASPRAHPRGEKRLVMP